MRNILISAFTAAAVLGFAGAASAQQIYLNFGPNPGYGPSAYDYGLGYGAPSPYYRSLEGGPRFSRPGGFKTWNGCQNGWTVQDGRCKPYRGY
jgi:hypothetical protein